MLALGRALMSRPRLLLLDEPSLGLAPRVAAQIMAVLRRLRDESGLTVVLVEQNARSALSIADHGVVLSLGRVVVGPGEGGPPLNAVIVTLGLLVFLQAGAGMIFGGTPRSFSPAFSIGGYQVGGTRLLFSPADLFILLAVVVVTVALAVLFRRTATGLRMRAAAFAPEVARLLGVRVGRTLTLGWVLAAVVGALAGALVAPSIFVGPSTFDAMLVFGFTAAVIGGLDSPAGAGGGGVLLGLALSYVSGYAGSDVVTLGALVVLVIVLMIRPAGLFARRGGRRGGGGP